MFARSTDFSWLVEVNRTGRKASVTGLWSAMEGEKDSVVTVNAVVHPPLFFCVIHSVVLDSAIPRAAAHWVPLSMGFSRQRYWSGLPFPSPVVFLEL